MAKPTRRNFPENFKGEAVRLAQAGDGNIAAVARNLDVHLTAMRDWIRQATAPAPDPAPLSPSAKPELLQRAGPSESGIRAKLQTPSSCVGQAA